MNKRVKLRASSESNPVTNQWIRHLIGRLIIEQLELPEKLKAKILYEVPHHRKER
ncbi:MULTISPECIES: hypothetical protein [Bacillus]|uniref:hypothetical protein n=1 Tax=Bacillus TaxID=1386 RepID=UPI000A65BFC4|nr:hypothetical protein [Bacillus mobilis]